MRRLVFSVLLALLMPGCQSSLRRFALAPPLWRDPDDQPVGQRPAPRWAGLYGDGIDATLLGPLAESFAFRRPGEARNVNALDEVPSSSWFENRIGLHPMSPEQVGRGACDGPPLETQGGRWLVISGKLEGVTPGFAVRAADGQVYLLKVDGTFRPERASTADVVGALLYHAAGFHVPCNQVVYFEPGRLLLGPDATSEDELGRKRRLRETDLERVLAKAVRDGRGRLRALASRYLPGKPLGPFPYRGVRADDPNDIIPHEDRRELRASRLLAAWMNRFDVREQNSLDAWVEEGGRRFVRHYQLDFGDALGSPWQADPLDRRVGHSYLFDVQQIVEDLLTLGLLPRPWYRARIAGETDIFGYFGWRDFVPSRWRPVQPNPAFDRMTWRDALWMVRIIVRFSDEHLHAVVARARLSSPQAERYLVRALIERRDRIAVEYLRRYNPLADPRLGPPAADGSQPLCFSDLAIAHAGVGHQQVRYRVKLVAGERLERLLGWRELRPAPTSPARTCLSLPLAGARPSHLAPPGSPDDHGRRYAVLEVAVQQGPAHQVGRLQLHFYDLGRRRGLRLVGLERLAPGEGE